MAKPHTIPDDTLAGDTRSRVIAAAADLIAAGGPEAATTRAVAAAASVQAPVIYRLFGDKEGLLQAVAEQVLAGYVAAKLQARPSDDPVQDLRRNWDAHVAFGLAHPAVFAIVSTARPSSAWAIAVAMLRERLRRIAATGRLKVSEEWAIDLADAVATGAIQMLLRKPPEEREALSQAAWEVFASAVIDSDTPPAAVGARRAASSLRATLDEVSSLSEGERRLLDEWLQRIADGR